MSSLFSNISFPVGFKELSRIISLVENSAPGYMEFLQSLQLNEQPKIIGITGAPGAGKSTSTDALIKVFTEQQKKVGVLCIDPSSPFHHGALLGDRIRMNSWYNNPNVFIRSLASKGNLGGLNPRILEITDVMTAAAFDYIIIETVGVGQSETEIASLADVTVVVLVPEAGDEVQTMKAGLMEIADVFVINKTDKPGAGELAKNLHEISHAAAFKTVATKQEGVKELAAHIILLLQNIHPDKQAELLASKAYYLLQQKRMANITKQTLKKKIEHAKQEKTFNLYRLIENL